MSLAMFHFQPMGTRRSKLTADQLADAGRLKHLFEKNKGKFSQESFGAQYGIGNQGMVWQYLNAHRPLNVHAADAFARGLGVSVLDFSPTLADVIAAMKSPIVSKSEEAEFLEMFRALSPDQRKHLRGYMVFLRSTQFTGDNEGREKAQQRMAAHTEAERQKKGKLKGK